MSKPKGRRATDTEPVAGPKGRGDKANPAPTSYDVARRAGVSQSAVSRALSNRGYVSREARVKIEKAARDLGFRPNALARSLITKRSRLVAIVIADLYYSFYVSILHQLSSTLRASGYQTLLFSMPSSADLDEFMPDVLAYQVDGVIMTSARLSSGAAAICRDAGIPVVLMNRLTKDPSVAAVAMDNRAGGRLVGRFLLAGGHARYGFVSGIEDTSTSRDREQGYREALGVMPVRACGNFTYDGGYSATLQLMKRRRPPDAIFCASDIMAMGALDAVRFDLGLTPAKDVSIVGFVNAAEAGWKTYDLTSVAASAEELSVAAVEILGSMIERPDTTPERRFLPAHLVIRSSARVPPGWDQEDRDTARHHLEPQEAGS
ncbi:MAG: LacI family DNA-binding transcriptional regulator [Pseudomonadota bacterium]